MGTEWGETIAVFVGLSVVAILMVPCVFILRRWIFILLPGICASVTTLSGVCLGYMFTGWLLVGPGHPNSNDWQEFIFFNVIIAAGTGIPGALLGLVIALLVERASRSHAAKPVDANANPVDTAAKPVDTSVQRLDKREPAN